MSIHSKYLFFYLENNSLESLTKQMQLSPLHRAVIERSLIGVKACLANGANVNAIDVRKWTPLHHATALGYKKISRLLKYNGADPKALTDTQATPLELRNFVLVRREKKSKIPLITTSPKDANYSPLTHRQYRILTGTCYLLKPVIPLHYLIKEWRQGLSQQESLPFIGIIQKKYEEFLLEPRIPHILAKAHTNDYDLPLLSSPGLGLFASQDYPRGVIIGEYLGRVSNDNPRSSYNLAAHIDGSQYSNELTRINDGLPNVILVPLANIHGLSKRYIFITSSPIKKGDQFCWTYGAHSVKLGPYCEMRPAALRAYIKAIKENKSVQSGFECQIAKLVVGLGITQQISLEEFMEVEKFRYLLETPTALFNLVFEGFLDDSTAHQLWQAAYFPACLISPSAPKELKKLVSIAIEARNYYRKLQTKDPLKAIDFQTAIAEITAKKGILATLDFANATIKTLLNRHPRGEEIRILSHPNIDKRKAIYGIGRKLTVQDIGKKVIRTAPTSLRGNKDWSYVPDEPTAQSANKDYIVLLKLEDTTFIGESEINRLLSNSPPTKIFQENNDDNWMLLEEYQEFVEKFSLDQFLQEEEMAEQDPMKLYEELLMKSSDSDLFKDSNIARDQIPKSSEIMEALNWSKEARQQLPTLQKDHRFNLPQKSVVHSSEILSAEKAARRMLKIDYNENNPKKISKQFHKLALIMHPDKGGDPLQFKKLNESYRLILKKVEQSQLLFKIEVLNSQDISKEQAEEIYELARNYFTYLIEELKTASHDEKITAWEKYYSQITNLNSLKVLQGDGFFEERFEKLVGNVREQSLYLKFTKKLEKLEKEFSLQDRSFDKIIKLENLIKSIKELEEEFDLSNQRNSWVILEQSLFNRVHLLFQDRILAFERTLAELYLRQDSDSEALEVRFRALQFYSQQTEQNKVAIIKVKAKDLQRQLDRQKLSTEKTSDKTESDLAERNLEPSQGASFEDKEARESFAKVNFSKKDGIILLAENIAQNLKFFAANSLNN